MREIKKDKNNIRYPIFFAFICLCAFFNLFFNLWEAPVQDWDEARHGQSAFEMVKSNNWIVNTYQGTPDYWNLKPPLGIWLIAISFKLFGVNIFSLRLFSALSALVSIILTMLFARRKFGNNISIISGAILTTCFSFIHIHGGRTGDFDSILTLLLIVCVTLLDKAVKNIDYLYFCFFTTSFAFLLKSFASFEFLGVIFLFFIAEGFYKKMKFRHYFFSLIIFLSPIIIWLFARYLQDGFVFIQSMVKYDLVQRSFSSIEKQASSNFYYLEPLFLKFLPWSLFLFFLPFYKNRVVILPKILIKLNPFYQNHIFIIWIFVPLLFAFLVKTKLEWYIMPAFPALSILIGWHLHDMMLNQHFLFKKTIAVLLPIFFIITEIAIGGYTFFPFPGAAQKKAFQDVIIQIHRENFPGNLKNIYRIQSEWSPSEYFTANAIKELQPKKIDSISKFLLIRGESNLLILPTQRLKELKKPEIIASNQYWSVIY
jgi:4-amino-4-deoxy-L-arabinose transferase-like glycosyltransferase